MRSCDVLLNRVSVECGVVQGDPFYYGIAQLLAVKNPDSKKPEKDAEEFQAIQTFLDIMP